MLNIPPDLDDELEDPRDVTVEYLSYINTKLRYTNTMLERIHWALYFIGAMIAVGLARYLDWV